MRDWLSFLTAAAGLAAAVLSCTSCGPGAASSPAPVAASEASPGVLPAIPLTTLAGDRTDVTRVTQGRAALVSLWATWCDGCEREMDELNRIDARAAPGGAVVIGIAVGEDRAKVADFVRRRGLRYVQLVDEDFAFADAVGERRVPATLVVGRDGRIVFRGGALDARGVAALREASEF
jgi:peroxiredoxin